MRMPLFFCQAPPDNPRSIEAGIVAVARTASVRPRFTKARNSSRGLRQETTRRPVQVCGLRASRWSE